MAKGDFRGEVEWLGAGSWTRHDLRRTGATMLARMGAHSDVVEFALNHKHIGGTLAATYNLHRYGAEVAAALQKLADALGEIEAEARRPAALP